jgi:hypothetical protein
LDVPIRDWFRGANFLWEAAIMRTTVDLPEPLLRKTRELAALRGSTLKAVTVEALENDVNGQVPVQGKGLELPLIRMPEGKKIDWTGFDFDDLLPDVNVRLACAADHHSHH